MRFSFFPGCVIPIRYPGMEAATRFLARKLGINLVDVKFGCCPSPTGLKCVHFDAWLSLAARNLCLTEEKGLDVVTICSGCTNTLREANHILLMNEKKRLFVNEVLARHGKQFKGSMKIFNLAEILARDEYLDRLEAVCRPSATGSSKGGAWPSAARPSAARPSATRPGHGRPLSGLKIGTHYGCHYYRPASVMQDGELDPRFPLPESMELILEALGANIVEYNRPDLCCGAAMGFNTGMTDRALEITGEKLHWMNEAGIDALAVPCPACFTQFDTGQMLLQRKNKLPRTFPVFHISELVAYALGSDVKSLNLEAHKIPAVLSERVASE